jgi:hypothetical protein
MFVLPLAKLIPIAVAPGVAPILGAVIKKKPAAQSSSATPQLRTGLKIEGSLCAKNMATVTGSELQGLFNL